MQASFLWNVFSLVSSNLCLVMVRGVAVALLGSLLVLSGQIIQLSTTMASILNINGRQALNSGGFLELSFDLGLKHKQFADCESF